MADESLAFITACEVIGERTELTTAQARGTVRLALQEAGLFDSQVKPSEMRVVARTLLAKELAAGGVEAVEAVCEAVSARLAQVPESATEDSPDAIFARLGLGT